VDLTYAGFDGKPLMNKVKHLPRIAVLVMAVILPTLVAPGGVQAAPGSPLASPSLSSVTLSQGTVLGGTPVT